MTGRGLKGANKEAIMTTPGGRGVNPGAAVTVKQRDSWQQAGEHSDQPRAEGLAATGELPLAGLVIRASRGSFDGNRAEAQTGEIIRAGAHVDFADLAGEGETVRHQFGRRERRQLEGPFVEIHVRMEAAALLQLGLRRAGRLQLVQGP